MAELSTGVRVLVTGGSGFIGSHVVGLLAAADGVETSVMIRPASDLWRLRACGISADNSNVTFLSGDLCYESEILGVIRRARPDVLIHLAAVYHVLGSSGGTDVEAVNLQGTLRLLNAFLAAGGRRFIFAGTCFEYGHHDAELLDEATPPQPVYDYAICKLKATEAILARGKTSGTETLVLRLFSPFGPLEDPKRIVPQMVSAALGGNHLNLSPGEQVRDYIYVEDVARAFVTAALTRRLRREQAIYNVCSAAGHSLRQLAGLMEVVLHRKLDPAWGKLSYRPREMMRLVGSNRRIQEDLGWTPSLTLNEGLRRTAAWLQEQFKPGPNTTGPKAPPRMAA
jgi:nucleoside-diphosphate-sugar epimerase